MTLMHKRLMEEWMDIGMDDGWEEERHRCKGTTSTMVQHSFLAHFSLPSDLVEIAVQRYNGTT